METSSECTLHDKYNNGLLTTKWGPPTWETLHCITFQYPVEPSERDKKNYIKFFKCIGEVLPCKSCRESYSLFIRKDAILTYDLLASRESLCRWLYGVHNLVNKKLGKTVSIPFEQVVKKYESLRQADGLLDYKITGPSAWFFLHSVSFGYPGCEVSEAKKMTYKWFFERIHTVYKSKYKFIVPETALVNRDSLVKWLYDAHNSINKLLGKQFDINYQQFLNKFESIRAVCHTEATGCVLPADVDKTSEYEGVYLSPATIKEEYVERLKGYAQKRGVMFSSIDYDYACSCDGFKNERNAVCEKYIHMMRKYKVPSLEEQGEFKGLPTVPELRMIQWRCTNLCEREIQQVLKLLGV